MIQNIPLKVIKMTKWIATITSPKNIMCKYLYIFISWYLYIKIWQWCG